MAGGWLVEGHYFGVIAMVTGAVVPAPVNGDPDRGLPLPVKALTALEPPLATHTSPDPSMAMLFGELRPLPE
jgi:hypothetical protein